MIVEDRSFVDTQTVEHFRCHLVSGDVFVLFLHIEVAPHHVFRLEQITVFHIFHFQIHRRQMISIHNENHTLIKFRETIGQLFDKLIHLVKLIYIIFPCIIFLFRFRSRYFDLRIGKHRFSWIISVSLYRDRVYIVRTLCGFHRFEDLIGQNVVFYPAHRRGIADIRHVFLGSKGVKSQSGKYRSSSIEVRLVVVDCMRAVAEFLQIIRRALAGCLFQDCLIRILARSEIMQAHTCDRLELRVRGSRSYSRHFVVSGGIFLTQFPEVRNRILGKRKEIHFRRIDECLQLQKQDINIRVLFLGLLNLSFAAHDIFHQCLGISVRLTDTGIKDRNCQTVRISVILVRISDISKVRR